MSDGFSLEQLRRDYRTTENGNVAFVSCDVVLALVEAVEAAQAFAEFKGAANTKAKWAALDRLRDALAPFRQEQP